MRSSARTRDAHTMRTLMVSTEMILACACAILLVPLYTECWREAATPVQMMATGGVGVVDIGRLMGFLTDNPLPANIERVYLGLLAVLFGASSGLALTSQTSTPDLVFAGQGWDAREVGRAALAFLTMVILIADATLSYIHQPHDVSQLMAGSMAVPVFQHLHAVTLEDPPPSYAVAVGPRLEEQAAI